MSMLYLLLFVIPVFIYYKYFKSSKKIILKKKFLVIGGSSGIGLEVAKQLYNQDKDVTITSRSVEKLDQTLKLFPPSKTSTIRGSVYDSTEQQISVCNSYDVIFYCAGISIPGFFAEQSLDIFEKQIKVNFTGVLAALSFFKKCTTRHFEFVFFSTTLSLFPIPGYSSYTASKGCLQAFYESEKDKLEKENVTLKIIYCCSVKTPGFDLEETYKPAITKSIEHSNIIANPAIIAEYIIKNINYRNAIAYDWFTYLAMIKNECELPIDYLLFPIAVVVLCIAKAMVKSKVKNIRIK